MEAAYFSIRNSRHHCSYLKQLLVLWNSAWIHFSFVFMSLWKIIQREQGKKVLLLWFFYISKLTWMVSGIAMI